MDKELYQKLEQLAYKRTKPFCYSCYEEAPSGTCTQCNSDDLMRLLPGVGCEWGIDWVIEEILSDELQTVDLEQVFEQSMRECYPEEVQIAWTTFDCVTLLKQNDPVGWRCALADYVSNEESEGNLVSLDNGSTYYLTSDIERFVE